MNGYFRTGDLSDKGRAESLVKTIDAEPGKGDIWLQRGAGSRSSIALGVPNPPSDVKQLEGMTWTDKGFMSCTPCKGKGFSGGVILNIYCPDGAKSTAGWQAYTCVPQHREFQDEQGPHASQEIQGLLSRR